MGQIVTYGVIGLCVFAWVYMFFGKNKPVQPVTSDDDDDDNDYGRVNPATGLPMMDGVDAGGNPYGVDLNPHDD